MAYSNNSADGAAAGIVAGVGCLWILIVVGFWGLVIGALLKYLGFI